MSKNINSDDRRTEIALARYTLILPIVRETCRRQRHQMRQNIAATIHDFPPGMKGKVSVTTLYRWEKAYRQGGFDALKPQVRQDKECRVISSETLDRAEALKREQPFRSARAASIIVSANRLKQGVGTSTPCDLVVNVFERGTLEYLPAPVAIQRGLLAVSQRNVPPQ